MAKSKAMKQSKAEAPKAPEVTLPLTVPQAAKLWGISPTRVRVLVAQGRVDHIKVGTGGARRKDGSDGARTILIQQLERPAEVEPGSLSKEQRAAKSLTGVVVKQSA